MRGDAGYHRVFWFTVLFTVGVIVAVIAAVPQRPRTGGGTVDWLGAIGLAAGLSAILLAITQGPAWGWSSPRTAAALVIGIAILIGWWRWEQHCRQPLVSTAMLSRRPILLTNIATVSVGMGLYFAFLGLTDFVQAPAGSGYGFGASVLAASVQFLLPGAMAGFITATVSGRYIDRFGARPILLIGGAIGVVGFAGLAAALLQSEPARAWQVILGAVLINAYISLAYGAIPALVVAEVDPDETAVATSMNAIARSIGSSVAAALVAVLLSRGHSDYPPESSFTVIFALGAATGIVAIGLIALSRPGLRPIRSIEDLAKSRAMNHEWG
jgi:hypothetical protein